VGIAAATRAGARLETISKALSAESGHIYAIVTPDTASPESLLEKLRECPSVISASPNHVYPVEEPIETPVGKIPAEPLGPTTKALYKAMTTPSASEPNDP
jgi:hypothetical protein